MEYHPSGLSSLENRMIERNRRITTLTNIAELMITETDYSDEWFMDCVRSAKSSDKQERSVVIDFLDEVTVLDESGALAGIGTARQLETFAYRRQLLHRILFRPSTMPEPSPTPSIDELAA